MSHSPSDNASTAPPAPAAASLTPLMRQYQAAKAQHPGALLFFRLGDFYELFFDDARTAARELEITLTARDRERQVPMCGVPFHAAEGHIARLLRKGFRVAVCEQIGDPKQSKGLVHREITRVWTPGTAVTAGGLESQANNYLAAIAIENARAPQPSHAALALLDLSTGEFRATHWAGAPAELQDLCADELARSGAVEVLVPASLVLPPDGALARAIATVRTRTPLEDWVWTPDYALPLLERQLGTHSLQGFGLEGRPLAGVAAGALLHYARTTQRAELQHLDTLRLLEHDAALQLDGVSARNLELVEPLFAEPGAGESTLYAALDCCRTPMGKRLLRATILRPLADPAIMRARWAAVGELRADLLEREELRRALGGVLDIERILARIALDSAGPRELLALAGSLAALPAAAAVLARRQAPLWQALTARLDPLHDLRTTIDHTLQEQAPALMAEGGFIRSGVHAELDALRSAGQTGRSAIAAIEERERTRTGIASLKVRFTSVFGYYIEITRANLKHVPPDYERKQTMVNAERFTTPELKQHEAGVLGAQERAVELERQLFAELRQGVLAATARLRATAAAVGELDLLAAFAHLAADRNWTEPTLVEEGCTLEAVGARHPVVEHRMDRSGTGERFVPNDLYLDHSTAGVLLITGPNMGGKSTYLRQAAMLVILAHMGAWVPATRMRFSPVDRIYTRIGASDNLARGRSTFMVEMTETATILNTATVRSLVLLDEMGRGTATYDGLSLAWATLEYMHNQVGARTLFATHYHELTLLAEALPRLRNLRVAVRESPKGIVLLHTVEPGAASKSYGIEVARLAGLPRSVLARAREVLRMHERAERAATTPASPDAPLQLTIFTPLSQRVLDRLEATDINTLTPLQALNLIQELKNEVEASRG